MSTRAIGVGILLAAGFAAGPGMAGPPTVPPPKLSPAPAEAAVKRGVVFIASGIGGLEMTALINRLTLPRAGVPHEIREFNWSHGPGSYFKDLQDLHHAVAKGEELAAEVRKIKAADPDRQVYLIGRSGGAGIVLTAAANLPAGSLERVILLSAAVSPAYDLRPALLATRREIVSFYSPRDWIILGWGTSQFGTIDREYGPSAGLQGFRCPEPMSPADAALYGKLVQIRWSPRMLVEGNTGGHTGTNMPAFVAHEVAPWLRH